MILILSCQLSWHLQTTNSCFTSCYTYTSLLLSHNSMQSTISFYQFYPSVHPSNSDISAQFFDSHSSFSSPIILIKFQGTRQRGLKMYGVGVFCKFCHLSRKQYGIGPELLWNTNSKSQVADRSMLTPHHAASCHIHVDFNS